VYFARGELKMIPEHLIWQKCPVCNGTSRECYTCQGTGIINAATGKPPGGVYIDEDDDE